MALLPLGSVIEIKGHQLLVLGYTSAQNETESVLGYYAVPYPVGYIGIEKTFFVPVDSDMDVIAEGYHTETSDAILKMLGDSLKLTKNISPDDMSKLIDAYIQILDSVTKED